MHITDGSHGMLLQLPDCMTVPDGLPCMWWMVIGRARSSVVLMHACLGVPTTNNPLERFNRQVHEDDDHQVHMASA